MLDRTIGGFGHQKSLSRLSLTDPSGLYLYNKQRSLEELLQYLIGMLNLMKAMCFLFLKQSEIEILVRVN